MSQERPFRVVIVGASVAGLSLANMLQANGIDYVVLEAYPTVAPQVGASIGMLPHGNRILDQLGLYEKVLELAPPAQSFAFRDATGSVLAKHCDMDHRLVERHGYPMIFLDRQMLLQVLYDNIKDKSKILTNKRVVRMELLDGGVQAVTSDGTLISGDILVGADGVHSTIRHEMWNLAASSDPGHFDPKEHEAPPCDNSCIFGISNPCPGIKPGDLSCVFRDSSSYLVVGGPNGRVYWFRFQKLPKTLHGPAIPRYTETDLANALSDSSDENILPDLKFSTLIENKISAVMTPLAEYVYKQWHFDRIITLGDSAHKFHPVGGQGGNAALESAALLTNKLVKALAQSSSGSLSNSQVESVFADVQSQRKPRLALNHRYSHSRARTEALDTPLKKLMALYLLSRVNEQTVTLNYCAQHPGGERLDMIAVRPHSNLVPYKDELLTEPESRGYLQWLLTSVYLALGFIAFYTRQDSAGVFTQGRLFNDTLSTLRPEDNLVQPSGNYSAGTGFPIASEITSWIAGLGPLQLYSLGHLIQPMAIMIIEGYRGRNKLTPLGLPIIWLILAQFAGLGVAMPLYFAFYTLISDAETYWWPIRRIIPLHYAQSILVACVTSEAVRIGLMYVQPASENSTQALNIAQQTSLLLIPLLVRLSGALRKHQKELPLSKSLDIELRSLSRTYLVVGLLGAVCHWFTLMNILRNSELELALQELFLPDFSERSRQSTQTTVEAGLCVYGLASYIWSVQAVWDLRRVGRARFPGLLAVLGIALGYVVFGPGATLAAIWYLRENAMSRTNFHQKSTSVPTLSTPDEDSRGDVKP
ncbi:hypothetical protein FSARC_5337 [Fusarium sarcochroum]|uniref:FAD-binding domain-containing protein n=1 Tax=Fusarium sarcochroum TaxID=1208366 RepID=A0A8H4TZL8_9HYPO|nr:hypothetical protein FSARC_5337 [Fusarium sarcochroum]